MSVEKAKTTPEGVVFFTLQDSGLTLFSLI